VRGRRNPAKGAYSTPLDLLAVFKGSYFYVDGEGRRTEWEWKGEREEGEGKERSWGRRGQEGQREERREGEGKGNLPHQCQTTSYALVSDCMGRPPRDREMRRVS